ncbi:MAG: hypothetical protein AB2689_01855 [Candidatus Thiodiazotropha taylori]
MLSIAMASTVKEPVRDYYGEQAPQYQLDDWRFGAVIKVGSITAVFRSAEGHLEPASAAI